MKATFPLLLALSAILFSIGNTFAGSTDTNGFRLTVELQDGSRLIGNANDETFQFRSDALGDMKLPLEKIRSIEFQPKTNSVKFTTAAGDVLSAQFLTKEIKMETAFGDVKLSANLLEKISISPAGGMAKNRPGLIALWSGEGNGNDSIGGNDATLTDVSFVDGQVGQAFSLDGAGSFLRAPNKLAATIGNGDGFTFTAWIKPTDANGYHPIFRWVTPGSPAHGISMRIGHSPADWGVLYADFSDAEGDLHNLDSAPGMVEANKFQFVTLTYNKTSGQAVLHLNGVVVAQTQVGTTMALDSMSGDFYFGCEAPGSAPGSWSYNKFFAGSMDEISIYNRALSTEEIKNIATEENHDEPPPTPIPNPQHPPFLYRNFD